MEIKNKVEEIFPKIVEIRRHIHENPEDGMNTEKTRDYVCACLESFGIPYQKTSHNGVIANIQGTKEGENHIVMLRADMDALCQEERTNLPFASKVEGKMHACGHDLHTSMLLGTAKILNDIKDSFSGTIRLVFQPGEEIAQGAKHMIEEGCMKDVEMGFGVHVDPLTPVGTINAKRGADWAAVDHFYIHVKGKGAHGATPQDGKDALVAASALVSSLQTLVSRECNPMEPLVVTVGKLHAGSAFNIIAEDAYLEGTCRSYDKTTYDMIPEAMKRCAIHIAEAYGCSAEVQFDRVAKPLINDDKAYDVLEIAANKVLVNEEDFLLAKQAMIGEDFSEYGELAPCVFAHLGADGGYPLHSSYINFKEEAMKTGIELEIQFALSALEELRD